MAQEVLTNQEVLYEVTKEDVEEMILDTLKLKIGKDLPFAPNKITVQYSDPGNGIYQIRLEFNRQLPQVLPLRGSA